MSRKDHFLYDLPEGCYILLNCYWGIYYNEKTEIQKLYWMKTHLVILSIPKNKTSLIKYP